MPPLDEQTQIVANLAFETSPLTNALSRLQREIELLREFRTRLVSDVVTGKLDVREAAVRLSDEEPLDTIEDDTDLPEDADIASEESIE
jgi:type I restriction enzyme S subunit